MYLKDIVICYDVTASDKIYASHFDYHVFFIRYYLSQQLKKIKFITDGTFLAINIQIGEVSKPMEIFLSAIDYYAKIDRNVYDSLADDEKSIYVIGLVKEALIDISQTKEIPLDQLLNDCNELIKMGLVYRWKFRHIKIADLGLKIKLNCELNTYDFKLIATVYKVGEKKPICEGCVIRTMPDKIHFGMVSKKIQQKNGKLIFYTSWNTDREFFYLKISDLNKGIVKTIFSKPPYPEDLEATETFLYLQESLKYDNNNFE